ncbi:carbohydrate ABC transporter permease [Paenibacillus thalictri]|uniref:Carbohydrate ABC transporter permease n=1 Tax=Paenibacillus thalictri TaxID=2527873 RepID=A0A4Q9DXW7_9BACL|nr:carbohydrate ABC transporter permease [Paenibacillus thalictri]TBL81969.1 carbohydrate ABC transporter permease [Paenibacillus thalictri]
MSALNRFETPSDKAFNVVLVVLLSLLTVIVLYPIWYCIVASFSDPTKVLNGEIWLLPKGWNLEGYTNVFENARIWTGYRNSIVYTLVAVAINLTMTVLAAYPLSRSDLKGRGPLMLIAVFTMFFSGGLIPQYLIVKALHIDNSMWAVVLPTALNTYNLIVMRTFFQSSIPGELYEASHMDGASNTRILFSVVLPLSTPILAVMFLFYSVENWNSYFNAMIYLSDKKLQTLPLVLREIIIQSSAQDMTGTDPNATQRMMQAESIKYASIILASLPMLILYPFIQKFFVQGVMIGAVKG